jgi:hypothetical protein
MSSSIGTETICKDGVDNDGDGHIDCDDAATGQSCSASGDCACTADSCDGWCNGSTCELFETIALDQPTFPLSRGIATLNSDVYWVSSSSSDPNADKYRVQRRVQGGSVETLLSNQAHTLGPLLLGAQRVFVLNRQNGDLRSLAADGSDLRLDQSGVGSFRYRSGRIYWPVIVSGRVNDLQLKSQSETDPSNVMTEGSWAFTGADQVGDIALLATNIAYGLNLPTTTGDVGNYEIGLISGGSGSDVFPSRTGGIDRLECDADDNYYWLRRTSVTGVPDLFMQNDGATTATAITTNLNVTDFTLSQPASGVTLVYYAYTDPADQSSGIRLYDTSSAKTFDVVASDKVGSLTTDDTYLYFFEANGHRLVRTPLPHVVLGLGK